MCIISELIICYKRREEAVHKPNKRIRKKITMLFEIDIS